MHMRITASLPVLVLAASALARDEDSLKLKEPLTPFFGPVVTAADESGRDALRDTFSSINVRLHAWLPLPSFPNGPHASGASCWGYVSPGGREYAIMCLERGFGYVDITNPSSPVIVRVINGPTSLWHDVKTLGPWAYGVSEGGSGIQVMDLRQIDSGVVTLTRNKQQNGHSSTHTIAVNPDSGYLYLTGANISNGGLIAVSTADPSDPVIAGAWTTRYVHEATVVSYTSGPYAGREIAFCASGGAGLDVVDVSNKSSMYTIGNAAYQGRRYAHQVWLTDDKRYLYLNDELDEMQGGADVTTSRVFDIVDPANPVLVRTFTTGLPSTDHNLYVHQGVLFESNYKSGVRLFDLTTPDNPAEIGYLDTYPETDGLGFKGTWSNFPYFPSGRFIVSDINRGLFIAEIDGLWVNAVERPGALADPSASVPVAVRVVERGETLDPASVELRYSVDGSGYEAIPMLLGGDGLYRASIPGTPCYSSVSYYVAASSTGGAEVHAPIHGEASAYSYRVADSIAVSFSDDFQTDRQWAIESINLSDGAWERAKPQGDGSFGDPTSDRDHSGKCFLTDKVIGSESDVDGGPARITSRSIDASAAADAPHRAELTYSCWLTCSTGEDRMQVEASADDGQSWILVDTIAPVAAWQDRRVILDDSFTPTSTVRVRYSVADQLNNSRTEAAVDAFAVTIVGCADCAGDFNDDGRLDVFDFLSFQTLYSETDPRADLSGDGQWNVFDFLLFQNLFSDGCGE